MQSYVYLIALIFSLTGLTLADRRWRLAVYADARASLVAIGSCVALLLLWDVIGIGLRIFATNQAFVSGLHLGTPDLPVEEVLLLCLISYVTLLIWRVVGRHGTTS